MELINLNVVVSSVLFAAIGIVILFLTYLIIEKITPENTWHEISKNKNMAVALVFSSIIIAVAMIISAAIHG